MKNLKTSFKDIFKREYEDVYFAPGRVNIIGEHIDYLGGDVLPSAISLGIKAYVSKRDDFKVNVHSNNFESLRVIEFDILNLFYNKNFSFANYIMGVFQAFKERGYKINHGFDILIDSNLPQSSGLSSSAALECLIVEIINDSFDLKLDKLVKATIARDAEVKFMRVNCGIMDQAAVYLGKKNTVIHLNTNTLDYEYIPFDLKDYSLVLCITNKPRDLRESKYNERVEETKEALELLKDELEIESLCSLDEEDLIHVKAILNNKTLYKRVHHAVTEQHRVIKAIDALKNQDILELGKLLTESDISLKNDYEVTGQHLDTITSLARSYKDCIGARMTGAGFGGSAIALVKTNKVLEFKAYMAEKYKEKTNIEGTFIDVLSDDGVRKL